MGYDIITSSGLINDYIHHIDLKQFGKERILSCYIAEFDNYSIIMDCGTSLEINKLLRYMKRNEISLSSVKYILTTHHHFDHNGGLWKLYARLKKKTNNLKIITNSQTKHLLNNYDSHLNRAKRTFGDFIGDMKAIEEQAFKIIEPIGKINCLEKNSQLDENCTINGEHIQLSLLNTPGHTPDHQCICFYRNKNLDFIYLGEAAGTIYHSKELLTMPTSMPVYFNYDSYMNSLDKLLLLGANQAGFCHFGVVNGIENVKTILTEHRSFMKNFRSKIIQYYKQKPETQYIFNKIMPFLTPRTDLIEDDHPIMKNIVLGVVYGMMMDLKYRES